MLGLKPTFAKHWEGDEGVPSTLGQPQILLDWGGMLGPNIAWLSLRGKLHLWLACVVVVSVRFTTPATDGFIF